ncbi:MAG: hypothetical protein ACKVJG_19195 [Candidatus Latescibacterota bacterium]
MSGPPRPRKSCSPPKRKLFSEIVSRVVDWYAIDRREEADGEIDEVQRLAIVSRCEFIDARRTNRLICGDCTNEIDLTEHFRDRLVRSAGLGQYG